MAYNYSKFSAGEYDLGAFHGPATGTKAPDFELSDVNGKTRRLLDFEGAFLVIETGSITCPLFQSRRKGMARAVDQHPNADFVILYVREAHPGQDIPQHQNENDKISRARTLKEQDHEGRRILVDTLAGEAHAAYGAYPNAVFIVNRNGCVVYRSDWNDQAATNKALTQLEAGKPATAISIFKPPIPPVSVHTLKRSGPGAVSDFLKSLPSLIWNNLILRNLRVLLAGSSKTAASAKC